MQADAFPEPAESVDAITPTELKVQLDAGDRVTILDARATGDFEEWHVEGETVEITNVPYFHLLDGVDEETLERIPEGDPLVVLCAKGGASEYIAGLLQQEGREVVHLEDGMHGWARIYEATEIERYDGPGTLFQYRRPSSGCLGYLLVAGEEAAVIDPLRAFTERYQKDATDHGTELTYAFDTHVHADHVSGVRALAADGVTGVIPELAVDRGLTYADDVDLATDGATYDIGDAEIEVLLTPGHTSGMTSYLIGNSFLATGDGLFVESVARPDLEAGDDGAPEAARQLYESLQERVLTLPDSVLVGGAHYSDTAESAHDGTYTATIGTLIDRMPALGYNEAEFVDLVLSDMPPRPANYETIIATNLGQRETADEAAFTLELGPNNCAASQDSMTDER
jgi:glyoxylase-like metal-dependent hydrolase (beta-lactamase superfamily II)